MESQNFLGDVDHSLDEGVFGERGVERVPDLDERFFATGAGLSFQDNAHKAGEGSRMGSILGSMEPEDGPEAIIFIANSPGHAIRAFVGLAVPSCVVPNLQLILFFIQDGKGDALALGQHLGSGDDAFERCGDLLRRGNVGNEGFQRLVTQHNVQYVAIILGVLGEKMAREIAEQPELWRKNADVYFGALSEAVAGENFEMVLLVARGSSDNAALYLRYLLEVYVGIPVSLAAPSVLTRFGRVLKYPKTLAVGISQSGAGPDVSEVLLGMRKAGHHTLAITNTPGSRMAQAAEHVLDLAAGPETSVAATKSYSLSLLAGYELTRALGGEIPVPALPSESWVEESLAAAAAHSGVVVRSTPVFALGRGFSYSTAHESALKLMECALIPCKAYSSADFEHGPKALAGAGSVVVSFDGDHEGLRAQGAEVAIAPEPATSEALRPIWQTIYLQSLALNVARARGLDPDAPRHLRKVTLTN